MARLISIKYIFRVFFLFFISSSLFAVENKALVVGISQYTEVNSLRYADADALQVVQYLSKFSDFNAGDVDLLLNLSANKINIEKSFQKIIEESEINPFKEFFFFYAGHGVGSRLSYVTGRETDNQNTNVFLVPSDAKPNLDSFTKGDNSTLTNPSFITTDWLANALIKIKADKISIVLDSCYSGSERFYEALSNSYESIDIKNRPSLAYIASAKDNQEASEYEDLGHGALSYVFFEFLKVKASNTPSMTLTAITYKELADDVNKLFAEVQVHGQPLSASHQPTFIGFPNYKLIENKVFLKIRGFESNDAESSNNRKSKIIIESQTSDYRFFADGRELFANPKGEFEISPGRHLFEFFIPKTGYRYSFVKDLVGFQIARESILTLGDFYIDLLARDGFEGIDLDKITVIIDGEYFSATHNFQKKLTAGTHVVEVKYLDAVNKKDIEIRPDSPLRIVYRIEPKFDRHRVNNINNVTF